MASNAPSLAEEKMLASVEDAVDMADFLDQNQARRDQALDRLQELTQSPEIARLVMEVAYAYAAESYILGRASAGMDLSVWAPKGQSWSLGDALKGADTAKSFDMARRIHNKQGVRQAKPKEPAEA